MLLFLNIHSLAEARSLLFHSHVYVLDSLCLLKVAIFLNILLTDSVGQRTFINCTVHDVISIFSTQSSCCDSCDVQSEKNKKSVYYSVSSCFFRIKSKPTLSLFTDSNHLTHSAKWFIQIWSVAWFAQTWHRIMPYSTTCLYFWIFKHLFFTPAPTHTTVVSSRMLEIFSLDQTWLVKLSNSVYTLNERGVYLSQDWMIQWLKQLSGWDTVEYQ